MARKKTIKSVSEKVANRTEGIIDNRKIPNSTTEDTSSRPAIIDEAPIRKDNKGDRPSNELVRTKPMTKKYAVSLVSMDPNLDPDYLQNNTTRAEAFILEAAKSQKELLKSSFSSAGARKILLESFYKAINQAEKEETQFIRDLSRVLFKKRLNKTEFLISLTEYYKSTKIQFFPDVNMYELNNYLKYAIGRKLVSYYNKNSGQTISAGNQAYVDYYNKINAGATGNKRQKTKYTNYQNAMEQLGKQVNNIIQKSGSAAQIQLASLFDPNGPDFITVSGDISDWGIGGILYEPIAAIITEQTMININDQLNNENLGAEVVGSTSNWLIKKYFQKTPVKVKDPTELRKYSNLAANFEGKTDLRLTVGIKIPRVLKIDIKNPYTKNSTSYLVNSPSMTLADLGKSKVFEKAKAVDPKVELDIKLTLAAILQYIFINRGFDRTQEMKELLVLLSLLVVADDRTLLSFYDETAKLTTTGVSGTRSNLVLIGEEFFYFSDILKGIIETYFDKTITDTNNSPLIQSTNATFKFAPSLQIEDKYVEDIYIKKLEAAIKYKDVSFYDRAQLIGGPNTEVYKLIKVIVDQFMSTAMKQLMTVNPSKVRYKQKKK